MPFFSNTTSSATSSKDVAVTWTAFCAVRPTANNASNLENPAEDERPTLSVPERQADFHKSTQQDNLDESNIGQLSPSKKEALMEILEEYVDVFAANAKAVAACRGPQ